MTTRGYRAASARTLSDQMIGAENTRLHAENYGACRVRKNASTAWPAGLGDRLRSDRPDLGGTRPTDLVQRRFRADAPRRLWVVDVTYVRTWQRFAYVAFSTDVYSRRNIGWNAGWNAG